MSESAAHSLSLAQDVIGRALKLGATSADALVISSRDMQASVRNGTPEDMENAESQGVGLRVFVGQQMACVSASDLSGTTLQTLAERAVHMAKLAPEDPFAGLAPAHLLAQTCPELDIADSTPAPETAALQTLCRETEDAALSVAGITNSEGASASYSRSHVALVTSAGFAKHYSTTGWSLSVSVLAGEGTGMERDYDYSTARHFSDLRAPQAIGAEAARRTLRRMNPRKIETCSVPVMFEPRIARSLLSSLAGAISGGAIANGTSFLKDSMGQSLFPTNITIMDDALRPRGLASRPFDAEGVAAQPRLIIENGVLQSWLLDVRSANKLGLAPTGHAVRSLASAPAPSITNFYLKPGAHTPEAMLKDMQKGLYVTETFGMGINLITGDFSQGAAGYWVENGELAYPVSEITIAGHLRDMFASLEAANDLEFHARVNSPTVRVANMTVAGT